MPILLETAVTEIYSRILQMEGIVIPTAHASPDWIYQQQAVPYWINRISGLTTPEVRKWDLEVTMRLILAHISQSNAGATNAQADSWKFIPRIVDYFETNRLLQFMSGSTKVLTKYVDPVGAMIESPDGMDVFFDRYTNSTQLFAEFNLTVPINV